MDSSTYLLIARLEYKSLKELKGKTLAVSTYEATSDVAARMMFRQAGVDPERELKIIQLGAERARYAALKEGIVEVAVLSPPTDSDATRSGLRVLSGFSNILQCRSRALALTPRSSKKNQTK